MAIKIFVTGASGYLGTNLVRKLNQKGYFIKALVRNVNKAEALKSKNVKVIIGDIININSYEKELKDVDVIYHLAAIIGNNNKELNFLVHVEAVKKLIEAAKKNNVKRIIYVSTISASYLKRSHYAESKLQAEKLFFNSGIPTTIIRPNLIIGRKSPQLEKISTMVKLPLIPVVGSGKKLIQPINVEQLSEVLIKLLENKNFINHTISISGSEKITFNQFLDIISKNIIGKTKFKLHLPIFACSILATILEKGLKDKAPLNKGQVILLNQDSVSSFNDVKKLFDLKEEKIMDIIGEK